VADLADIVARLTAGLHTAGLPVGPDRAERFTRAVTVAQPRTLAQLRACARVTLSVNHDDGGLVDQVFAAVFEGLVDPADSRGSGPSLVDSATASAASFSTGGRSRDGRETPVATVGSDAERLSHRDFGDLSPDELLMLATAMARLRVATPVRRSRRTRRGVGSRVDLRATLRLAHRSAGEALGLVRQRRRDRTRRLVVLCDISGSMAPYARALLQLLYCAKRACRAEIFTFATQLTRLTTALGSSPARALAEASAAAPDWSSGTRIGAAIQEFLDRYGRRGMARGAVILIISDGWETGTPTALEDAMRRLKLLAYRIVWANPRTQSARYQPLVGGMAAAWPYCDAVVSAHSLDTLDELLSCIRA
jgi:uncharacterized protein with von Willebrand factor type A (vWA) domain